MLVSRFIALLEKQVSGDAAAIDELRALKIGLNEDGWLYHLFEEWKQAFSCKPGSLKALPLILCLARKIQQHQSDDKYVIYDEPEWKKLIGIRGFGQMVDLKRCRHCGKEYASVQTSGFLDMRGLACLNCGDVYFASTGRDTALPPCECGGSYQKPESKGCPYCGAGEYEIVRQMSSYEYFEKHKYRTE